MSLHSSDQVLYQMGLEYPGVRCFSKGCLFHPSLQITAMQNSILQAQHERCYHWELKSRYAALMREFGISCNPNEVAATGHIGKADTPEEAAREMFHSWELSPGHWRVISQPHKFYGVAMEQGGSGVWYGTITVVF